MINRDEFKGQNRENIGLKVSDVDFVKDERPVCILVGINAPTYSSRGIIKGIEECGFRCEFVDFQKIKMEEGVEGLAHRLIVKAKTSFPDLIIMHIQNPESVSVETFAELQRYAPVVNLTFDQREDISWYKEIAPKISLTCFASSDDVKKCEADGIGNTIAIHSSCNYDFYKPPIVSRGTMIGIPDIAFIGTNYSMSNLNFPLAKDRQDMCAFLKKEYGSRFLSIGMGQQVSKYVKPEEELAIYHQAKIIISHNNFYTADYSSDRLWRAMGSGAFVLSAYFPGIDRIFEKGVHLDYWTNFFELKKLIDFYLENEEERKSIAQIGANFVRENHRWADRISVIASTLKITH